MKRVLQTLIGLLLTAGLLYWAFRGKGVEALRQIPPLLERANKIELLLACLALLVSNYVRGARWIVMVRRPVSRFSSFAAVCAGYAVNNVLPRGGEIVRLLYLNRTQKIPLATATATIGAERLLDVVVLGLVIMVALVIMPEGPLDYLGHWLVYGRWVAFAGFGVMLGLITAIRSERLMKALAGAAEKHPAGWRRRLFSLLHSFTDGLSFMRSARSWVITTLWTIPLWGLYMATFTLGLDAFGLLERIGARGAFLIFAVSGLSTLVPTPASAGGYHVIGTAFLVHVYGVDRVEALAFITAFHGITYFGANGLGSGLIWLTDVLLRRRRLPSQGSRPGVESAAGQG
ncbi:MAG: flippase-like domain-containing protein [Nitrospirae bacterium]|nr:flippase-like domain-containing protein [Nitrospirota bacterium]